MSDDTYGMHDHSGTLLGRPPSRLVAWDPGFVESDKHVKRGLRMRLEAPKKPKLTMYVNSCENSKHYVPLILPNQSLFFFLVK